MRFLHVATLLAFCAGSVLQAATINLGDQAGIDLPDSWTVQPQQATPSAAQMSVVLSALSAEKNSMLQIQVFPNPEGILVSQPDFIATIKDHISNLYVAHGGLVQFTGEGAINLNNVPAYLIQYTVSTPSAPSLVARNYQLAANGKIFVISFRTVDAAADANLQAIANSFHFDSPPTLPTPRAHFHRIRYYLMAGAGVVVLLALGVGFYYYRQRQLYE